MTNFTKTLVLICAIVFACPSPLMADGWWESWTGSNKSKTIDTERTKIKWPSASLPKWQTPSWMTPSFMRRSTTSKRKSASTWSKMSKATKNWWDKTVDLLDPYPDPKPVQEDSSVYGNFADSKKKPKTKGSWMSGLWGTKEKEEVQTIGDWMDLSRPQ